MGTDIHSKFQKRTADGWVDVSTKFEGNRHYQLFAVLANVRNGRGFAGIITGEAVVPIAMPRGLPKDLFSTNTALVRDGFYSDEDSGDYFGDHSFSWLTANEILEYAANAPSVVQTGLISLAQYRTWKKGTCPETYCGGVSGPKTKVITEEEAPLELDGEMDVYVRVSWISSLKEELGYFFDEVARLKAEHGEVRFVFGFDS